MRFHAAVLLALALLLPGPARAASLAPPPPPDGPVAPGAEVVTVLPALPPGSEECELFLVPDTGAPIRVSREISAHAREVRWRMPAVAARTARLVLRVGGEHEERESGPSAAFALAALPDGEAARLLRGRSEAGARLESSAGARLPGLRGGPEPPSLAPGCALASAVVTPSHPLPAPAENARVSAARGQDDACPARASRPRANTPAFVPLRN